jgi:hypothetical protein
MNRGVIGCLLVMVTAAITGCASFSPRMQKEKHIPQTPGAKGHGRIFSLGQPWNDEVEAGFRPADVRLSWTAEGLFVHAGLEDGEVGSRSTSDNQKMWELGDVFEMFLMVEGRRDYVELHVTPGNQRLHLQLPGVGGEVRPGSQALTFEQMLVEPVGFSSSTRPTKRGWSVSAKVPATVLGLKTLEPGLRLRVAFARYDASPGREPVLSTTASHPVVSFHRPEEWMAVTLGQPRE